MLFLGCAAGVKYFCLSFFYSITFIYIILIIIIIIIIIFIIMIIICICGGQCVFVIKEQQLSTYMHK